MTWLTLMISEDTNMSKKVNQMKSVEEVAIEQAINEINEAVVVIPEPIEVVEVVEPIEVVKPVEVKVIDITAILAVIPDTFTPATLDKLFQLNDGGKTVRRHLRKHFAGDMAHNMKDKWSFNKVGNKNIIEYFASKYASDMKAMEVK